MLNVKVNIEIFKILSILLVVIFSHGCSTIATLSAGAEPKNFNCSGATIPRVYSGVVNDWRFVTSDTAGNSIAILDIPLSLVADTIVLPYTIYLQANYGNLCNGRVNTYCANETIDCDTNNKTN